MRTIVACIVAALLATAVRAAPPQTVVPAPASGAFDDTRRGWHFYDDPAKDELVPRSTDMPPAARARPAPSTAAPPEVQALRDLQRLLEQLKSVAIMNPTEDNVRRYMALEIKLVKHASRFADVAQKVAWASPELDPTTEGRPVNAQALEVFEQVQMQQRASAIAELGKDHVLLFFMRGDCPYCHAFGPVLRAFSEKHHLQVVPISLDGGTVPGFSQARGDNGIAATLKVKQVPALFLAQPVNGRIMPVGVGVLAEGQLLERLDALRPRPGAPPATPLTTAASHQ